ncbi:dipeptidase [Sphingomicrobium nitratireducens]|uniref:dipeptidase n=1 Tax=Sphingomicrobium nitratireducens TaxID=2964666 RepID=UPI00223EC533|nr:dipeptidase [Sphingomicrobium nitratireducens]
MFLATLAAALLAAGAADPAMDARIAALLEHAPVIDGHNDLPYALREAGRLDVENLEKGTEPLMTDMARLHAGGVGAQLWSVYIDAGITGDAALHTTLQQIDIVSRMVEAYPDDLAWALTADGIETAMKDGKVASLIGVEGGHQLGGTAAALRQYYRLGARYMTLTHSKTTDWADSATDMPVYGGLSDYGRQVVAEMNRIGMLVDLSHVSEEAMMDALDATRAPVIFSHSSARAIGHHPRNVPDAVLARMTDNGGVVMVNFLDVFIDDSVWNWYASKAGEETRLERMMPADPEAREAALAAWEKAHPRPSVPLSKVADHVDHVARVAGYDHIGLGGDLDGIDVAAGGLGSVDAYPLLLAELARRGWSDENLAKLTSGNFLRVLRGAEATAAAMTDEKPLLDSLPDAD